MVAALRRGDQTLFERVFLAHCKDCIAYLMREDKADRDQAYDATLDALIDFRFKLVDGKISYGNLRYLLTLMARQRYQRIAAQTASLVSFPPEYQFLQADEEVVIDARSKELLDAAWAMLPHEGQELLIATLVHGAKMTDIAKEMGVSAVVIRQRKRRYLLELRSIFAQLQVDV